MLLAVDAAGGTRIRASRGVPATCPACAAPMIAKCGEIVTEESGA